MSEEINFADLLNQAEKSGFSFSALPASEYDTKILSAEVRQTGTGKNKIVVRFEVTAGPYQGRNIFNDFVLTTANSNAMVIFFRQMAAMGLDSKYFSRNPSLQQVAQDLVGREQRLRLGIRNWQGVDRNSVLQIIPAGGGAQVATAPPGAPQGTVAPRQVPPSLPPVSTTPPPLASEAREHSPAPQPAQSQPPLPRPEGEPRPVPEPATDEHPRAEANGGAPQVARPPSVPF